MTLQIARSSTGLPAPTGFVTGGGILQTGGFSPSTPLPQSTPLFGEGGLFGAKSKEEQAILDAPDEFFAGDTKEEIEESRKKAIKAVRERRAEDGRNEGLLGPVSEALGLPQQQGQQSPEQGLLGPQAEGPGFLERLTRAGSQGGLLDIIGRTAFGAPEIEKLQNQAKREELTANKRRRGAQQELTGLLSSGEQFDPGQVLGLLSEVAPDALAGSLLGQILPGQGRAEPSVIRELKAIGIDPNSPEGRKIILDKLKGQNAPDELLQRIELQLSSLQLENEREDIKERKETKERDVRAKGSALRADLKNVSELVQLNDSLEGTSQQPGLTFQDIRRSTAEGVNEVAELFGVDRSAARKIISQRDAFNKLANNFLIKSSARFVGGTLTDQKLSTLRSSMAGVGITPGANRVILADTLDALLEAAEIEGVSIDNESEIRELAKGLREKAGLLEEEASGVEAIPGFNDMTKEQQDELRARLPNGQ